MTSWQHERFECQNGTQNVAKRHGEKRCAPKLNPLPTTSMTSEHGKLKCPLRKLLPTPKNQRRVSRWCFILATESSFMLNMMQHTMLSGHLAKLLRNITLHVPCKEEISDRTRCKQIGPSQRFELQSSAKFSSKSAANTEEITDFGSKMLQIPWK